LRASLDKLRHVSVGTGMVNEVTADLNDVKTALTTLVDGAHGRYQAQTSALSSALGKLKTSVSDLAAHPSASSVSGVVAALGAVSTAGQNLLAAVNTSCLSASPVSST
jgi:phage-related protein